MPNVLSPRDLVFRPDNMDETVPHTIHWENKPYSVFISKTLFGLFITNTRYDAIIVKTRYGVSIANGTVYPLPKQGTAY